MSFYGSSRLPFTGRGRPFLQLQQALRLWQCLFMEVQGCRLPAFKTRQNSPNPSLQLPGATQAAADLSCSSNKSLRPWQCLFYGVQGCHLPTTRITQVAAYPSFSFDEPLRPWHCLFTGFKAASASLQNLPTPPCGRPFYMQLVLDSPMALIPESV